MIFIRVVIIRPWKRWWSALRKEHHQRDRVLGRFQKIRAFVRKKPISQKVQPEDQIEKLPFERQE